MSGVHGEAPKPTPAAPTALSSRSLAPDLARGLMLVFIALANAHTFLHLGGWNIRSHPVGGSDLDATVSLLLTVFVDGRSYTLFAALFGYGMVQILRRQERNGSTWPETRKLLRRRGWWLVGFGVVHAILLFFGDILAAYGLVAVVLVGTLRDTGRTIVLQVAVLMTAGSLAYGLLSVPIDESADPGMGAAMLAGAEHPLTGMLVRAVAIVLIAPVGAITAAAAFVIGAWAARHRILEEPERQLLLLRRTAVLGVATGALGGLPLGLQIAGVLPFSAATTFALGFLHALTGYAGGLGYAAAIALLAVHLGDRRGPVVTALSATGQRSLTCYLLQSVCWQLFFAGYLLDLGGRIGTATSSLIGIGVWVLTVVVADLLRRAGQRGPFEVLIRRLTYGRG